MLTSISSLFSKFRTDRKGATAIEYGLIAALISVVIISTVTTAGTNLKSTFQTISDKLATTSTSSSGSSSSTP